MCEQPASTRRPVSLRFLPSPSDVDVDPLSYDFVIVTFSGGKDSLAPLLLLLLELGVPASRIELWHHDVDGREGSHLMGLAVHGQLLRRRRHCLQRPDLLLVEAGGFEGELLRLGAPTAGYLL